MANIPQGMSLHPRGFIGAANPLRIARVERPFENLIQSHQFHFNAFKADSKLFTENYEVEALYESYLRNTGECTGIAFRTRILKAAMHAFGGKRFDYWYAQQYQSPAVGDTHRRFLDDTLRFINSGKREMSPMTWAEIIEIKNDDQARQFSKETFVFFGNTGFAANPFNKNSDLLDVLQMWVSVPNGIEDLLLTLHVLFGNY